MTGPTSVLPSPGGRERTGREIAHLTDVAATYKASYEALKEINSQLAASMLAPPVAEPAAPSRELNEYGDVGAR